MTTTAQAASTQRRIESMTAVSDIVRSQRRRLLEQMSVMAALAREVRMRTLPVLEERSRGLKAGPQVTPVDPSELVTTALHILDYHEGEIRWTRWLRGILAGNGGARSRDIVYAAIRDAVLEANPSHADALPSDPSSFTQVRAEVRFESGSQIDLVMCAERTLIVLENKLFADWHDGVGTKQAESYQADGEKERARRGLDNAVYVLLTAGVEIEAPDAWTKILYEDVARHLRRRLAASLQPTSLHRELLEFMPALEFVMEIERLLRRSADDRAAKSPWSRYHDLRRTLGKQGERR